jgi:hypothetical protein
MLLQSAVSKEDLLTAFQMMMPSLLAIASRALSSRDRGAMEIVVRLIEYMRRNGCDPDPHDVQRNLLEHWDKLSRKRKSGEPDIQS